MNITPETKVGDLLDALPEAEKALIAIAPRFKAREKPTLLGSKCSWTLA